MGRNTQTTDDDESSEENNAEQELKEVRGKLKDGGYRITDVWKALPDEEWEVRAEQNGDWVEVRAETDYWDNNWYYVNSYMQGTEETNSLDNFDDTVEIVRRIVW
ncbi:hypothetical protein [Natronorubrum sp. DTA28]|uniref:hypothetical protein n=1 Tax=Natronorubrum sp. DTA28 TaxID=3447019 RepID=UPI003F839151